MFLPKAGIQLGLPADLPVGLPAGLPAGLSSAPAEGIAPGVADGSKGPGDVTLAKAKTNNNISVIRNFTFFPGQRKL